MNASSPLTACRICGTALAAPAKSVRPLCPACLLDFALGEESDAGELMEKDATEPPPESASVPVEGRFAHYTLARHEDGTFVELGRGGMGVTYRATDETLRCDVALKVVNPEFVRDARVRARFLREARAAAGLRHPHVASVFFFGERAQDGQLFYAMELVEGETLHARVRRCGGLPVDTVLTIGSQVADALAATEARGLTHRDLKPANLMLVEGGVVNVKVIDFGLAKILAAGPAEGAALTRTQDFVGTPAFASPEQGNVWQEADLRSDFYALGATLWFALTGRVPFAGRTPGEIHERQLAGVLPLDQLRDAGVPRQLVDLLRALLSPEPAGRPQSARDLAAALDGCLRPSAKARARSLAAIGGIFLLIAGWWAVRHHDSSDIARQNALLQHQTLAQQQQLNTLQTQLQQQTQLIALVNAKLDRNAASSSVALASAQAEAAQERGINAETLRRQLADEQADARALLAQIDQRLTSAQTNARQWQELKRAALTRLGEGELAAGRYAAAVEPYQQALALVDAGQEPLAWCDAAGHLASALEEAARYAEAAPLLQQVVERRTAQQGLDHPDTLRAMRDQARLLHDQGSLADAEALYRRVLTAQERTLGGEDRETLRTLNGLASLLVERGRNAEAEASGRRCLEACERTLGAEDPLTLGSVNNLASTLYAEGHYAEAAALDRRVLEARERLLGADHPLTLTTANNLGNALQAQGDFTGAEALFRRVWAASERTLGPDHPITLRTINNLARVLSAKGDQAAAESFYRRAFEGHERTQGPDHPDTLSSLGNLADALQQQGKLAEAEPLLRRALEAQERTLGPDHPSTLVVVNDLALLLQAKGDLAAAEPLYRRSLEGDERTLGPDHPDTLSSLSNLAQLLDAKGDLAAAEPLYMQAQTRMERVLSPQHPYRLDQEHFFSLFREKQGRLTEALALATQVQENCKNLRPQSSLRRTYEEHFKQLQQRVR